MANKLTNDQLNRLAAKKVMKVEYTIFGCGIPDSHLWRESVMVNGQPFNPCESIADAWMLVEKIREDGWKLILQYCREGVGEPPPVEALFTNGFQIFDERADTAPLAITKACLKAMKVEEGL